ncbi:dTMP kinase [Oceanibacterium hippocampi]|uniref:Thymidylate kinase n=1 Tax=Oceanibacterium hippocampi TaxID=745714 RepID=A0A1Y5T3E5_9PROT|nr:dTMP kinase [Oceanibacterium hippocampi]SLN54825.1 Thymidylate kinase [Oceanibacterium hippocampi]
MKRGRFITLEGGEGAGKSTQSRRLASWLRGRDIDVVETREPGGAPGADAIRALLVTGETGRWTPPAEALLHYAARAEHLARKILPALDAGQWVLCDRFADSTMAYQGYGHELGRAPIEALEEWVVGASGRPDLTLIFDIAPEAGLARAGRRGGAEDRYERMDIAFHARLRDGFLDIARREPERCVVLDAGQPEAEVAARAVEAVAGRLFR